MWRQIQYILTILFIALNSLAWAQNKVNYFEIRKDNMHWTCTSTKPDSVDLTLKCLRTIDTSSISEGLYEYYYDLGMTYYIKALGYKQREFYDFMIASFMKCIAIDKNRGDSYYNLALIYYSDKKFDLAKANIKLYKKHTKKKYWDKEFIEKIEKNSAL